MQFQELQHYRRCKYWFHSLCEQERGILDITAVDIKIRTFAQVT